jgi:ankyrin repeat protein
MKAAKWTIFLLAFTASLIPSSDAQEKATTGESAAGIIESVFQAAGLDAAVQKFKELRSTPPGRYEFKENEFNSFGYRLIRQGRFAEAVRVFGMNVEMFPKSANVYDSLSEGYLYLGDRDKAEQVLKTALQMENAEKSFVEQLSGTLQGIEINDWQIRSETREVFRFRPGESTGLRGPYLGQDPPGEDPKIFARGIVSVLGYNDFCASFSPDGKEFYFNRGMTIMVCRLEKEGWTAPEPAAFSRGFRSHTAHLAFDNQRLFFGGSRPSQPYGIWLTERTAAGWLEPRRMWDGMYATSSKNGNIYFGVEFPSPSGIVCTRLVDGRYTKPVVQAVGFGNSNPKKPSIFHPGIAPDEKFIVFDDNNELYVSFREDDGSWGVAVSLGEILKERIATIPSVSPDGNYLFYASHNDVHWISTKILEKLRPQKTALGASALAQDLFDAIRNGDLPKVKTLVEHDPSLVKVRNARQSTPLHVAVDSNNAPLARYLIEKGADLNAVNGIKWTPLFYVKEIDMAGLLLEKGADINFVAGDVTPLSNSVWRENRELAEYLLSKGSGIPALKTPIGLQTAIRALKIGSLRYFEEGLRQGIDPLYESEGRSLWLHYASESRSPELIDKLIGLGVSVDRRNVFGFTPLHIAASRGNTPVVKLLVERGADRNARTNDGKTPYNLAVEEERGETAELLKSLGADQGPPRFPSLSGEYLGQPKPGRKAVLFSPGIVSGRHTYHGSISATPAGNELFWSVGSGERITMYRVRKIEGRWTGPEVFSKGDVPFVSPDGKKLYFVGMEQTPGTGREIIYVRDRTLSGWSEPRALPEIINSLPGIHWGVSVDREGSLYFSAGERVRYSEYRNGRYGEPVILDSLKDDNAYSPFISPDGSYLLANIEDEGDRLVILFKKKDGAWTAAIELADIIGVNHGFCPMVTPDGRYLFFVSMLDGIYAPYWMDASFIEELRKKSLRGN